MMGRIQYGSPDYRRLAVYFPFKPANTKSLDRLDFKPRLWHRTEPMSSGPVSAGVSYG